MHPFKIAWKTFMTILTSPYTCWVPFKCDICGKDFREKSTLTIHQRSHLPDEERYKWSCEMCGKKFPEKGNLATHLNGVHGVDNGIRNPNDEKYKKNKFKLPWIHHESN